MNPITLGHIDRRLGKSLLYCWLILSSLIVKADSDRFTASVSSPSVTVGDQIQITFTVNGSANVRNFKAPSFSDFNVLMGPSQSSNVQIINGSFSQSISFTYILEAVKEGNFRIGGAEVLAGNDKLVSNGVTVNVAKGRQGGNAGGGGESGASSKNVFLKASIDKSSAYEGEAMVLTYRLYTRVTLLNYSLNKLPSLSGFWSQEIEMPQQPVFHQENFDGVNYQVAELKKFVLFPQRSGRLEIDPMQGEVIARVQAKRQRSNDPFDIFNDPFFNNPFFNNSVQDVKVPLNSAPLSVTIKELPPGAPLGYSGAVGKLSCEVSLDKSKTKANEAVTLKIRINGKGNIKLIEAPSIEFPPDMETYEPKESVNVSATAGGVTGSKSFDYLIIPRTPGEYKIPVGAFSYYDLEKKSYVTLPSPELTLTVEKGSGTMTTTTTVTGVNKSDVQLLGKDIQFIKTNPPQFIEHRSPFFRSFVFNVLSLIPVILFGLLTWMFRRHRIRSSNVSLMKQQRASKTALKRLSTAKGFLDRQERDKFLDELFRALWGFVGDKLGIPVADLSRDSAAIALREKGVSEAMIESFLKATDDCEFARFAGSAGLSESSLYQQGLDIITQLENAIKS